MPSRAIRLSPSELASLLRPIVGDGGFQTLLRKLQGQVDRASGILRVSSSDHEKMIRYKREYGLGGFQDRIPERYWGDADDTPP